MLVIPAIDLKNGKCVRLSEGRQDRVTTYSASPLEIAARFASSGAQWIHVVDLDGAFEFGGGKSPNRQIAREIITRVNVFVQFGGGLRSIEDVAEIIEAGAARVVIGTLAVESPDSLAQIVQRFGSRVCVGIDARDGEAMVRGWQQPGTVSPLDLARSIAAAGVTRIVYTDIARDGMLSGLNIEKTCEIARASGLNVTASGGVASLDDIQKLIGAGEPLIDSVIIGKALYEGRFTLEEAFQIAS
ncbi:MAG TPA: 1-(5-phosphoribosyl)-5-[(5-phosphoribosylamino)methylideneamino]imidazole-4-carboxamide isomerase [Pyrinomonadaceae bacterium]|nr:1-(5-phosphoribosyl)-5-[(5-phosphoribosylamino)methylideneamino]imidazole-4-carboxamide isomerase [Pyrinomonadaceae bacterium]